MNSLDKQYVELLFEIMQKGSIKEDRTGTGTRSIFGRQIRHNMSEGFPLLTTKRVYFKGIVTELLWFLRGDTRLGFLHDHDCHIWDGDAYKRYSTWNDRANESSPFGPIPKLSQEDFVKAIGINSQFADSWGDLGPVYGKQWRRWEKYGVRGVQNGAADIGWEVEPPYIDQITNLIHDLKTNPDSRRLMVNAWNVAELDAMTLPPCHYGFQVYTRELTFDERKALIKPIPNLFTHEDCDAINLPKRSISLMWNQRSVDTPLGLPFNIASYGLLLTIIAEIVNMVPEELIGNLGDCHVYRNQEEGVREQITRKGHALPTLHINTEFWLTESGECGIGPLTSNVDALINGMEVSDFIITDYCPDSSIKYPLSN